MRGRARSEYRLQLFLAVIFAAATLLNVVWFASRPRLADPQTSDTVHGRKIVEDVRADNRGRVNRYLLQSGIVELGIIVVCVACWAVLPAAARRLH